MENEDFGSLLATKKLLQSLPRNESDKTCGAISLNRVAPTQPHAGPGRKKLNGGIAKPQTENSVKGAAEMKQTTHTQLGDSDFYCELKALGQSQNNVHD